MLGFCEQTPMKSFNLFISSEPSGHDILDDCKFREKQNGKIMLSQICNTQKLSVAGMF